MTAIPDLSPGFMIASFLASFIACFFSSLAGGGAGLILLPILLLLGLPFVNALACHKLAVGFIGLGSGYRYTKAGLIDWQIFWWTGLTGVPFVILGTRFAGHLSGETMRPILGIMILVMVTVALLRKSHHLKHQPRSMSRKLWLLASLMLAPMAFYSGWVSAGAGIFTTYLYLQFFKYDQLHSTAMTLSANGIFWNMIGAGSHVFLGHTVWGLAPGLVGGALLGSYCGASLGIQKGNKFLRIIFLSSAFVTGVLLLFQK
ncbi:MAG: sulfite exporter TauE/SafE family protein [Leptolyngbyaceae cyanobacterium MAG.088]|nr:sulfite exporter TauE/SafE family protein [Leptolyngbyaceae cyanobacterium MAG.088]